MTKRSDNTPGRRLALVTGGSRGIGLELAKVFARHDHDLVLVARDPARLEQAAKVITAEGACCVVTIPLDLAAGQAPVELVRQLDERGLQVDVLVNAAGIGHFGAFAETEPESLEAMLRLNMVSLSALTRLLLPGMIGRGRGIILNVASLVAFFAGGAGWAAYVASKHFVLAFSRGLGAELAGTGVSVTALCPGPSETAFAQDSGAARSRAYRWLPQVSLVKTALAGYRAAVAGRKRITPGVINKIFAFLGELPPRAIAQAVFGFLLGGSEARRQIESVQSSRPKGF